MKYVTVLISAILLTACGFDEPSWLDEARTQEKNKRPLCTRLAGALNEFDKGAKPLKTQQEFDNYLASKRTRLSAAVADCKARSKTFSD